jgi:hypothetical protein
MGLKVLHERCAGGDIHKKTVTIHVVVPGDAQTRTFGTSTRELLTAIEWLTELKVTHFAMESTGVYWKPLYSAPGKACAQGRRWFSETEQTSPTRANLVRSKPNQRAGNESCVVHG